MFNIGDLVKWKTANTHKRVGVIIGKGKAKQDFNLREADYVDIVWTDGNHMRAFDNSAWWRDLEVIANA